MTQKQVFILIILIVCAVMSVLVMPFIGNSLQKINLLDQATHSFLFWQVRLPRVLFAFLAGAALALSGMVLQSMFRNPLATSDTLGITSGASCGVALAVKMGISFTLCGIASISLMAFMGALCAITGIYMLTIMKHHFTTMNMLIAGLAVNFFCTSIILLLQYITTYTDSFSIIRWIMGGLSVIGYTSIINVTAFFLIGLFIIILYIPELDLLLTGEEIAVSRGLNIKQTKIVLFFTTSLLVGSVVAFSGPISFVGMMTPYLCRFWGGSNHRFLVPASVLFGGTFLLICDTIARTCISYIEIPVGIITSLLGAPFFLWILIQNSEWEG